MIVDVARETFYAKNHHVRVNSVQFKKRALQVKEFISSNGGDSWYKSYLNQFGAPTTPDEFNVATLIGVSEKKLGYYYLRHLSISPDQMKSMSCNSPNFNINPTMKGFCGLANFNAAIAFNDSQSLADFHKRAKWFLENQKNGKYEWSFDLPAHNQKAPWVSGLTQSLAISVLLREYQLTNDEAYLKAASEALAWIKKPIQQGGCSIRKVNGTWYEEYPNIRKPSHVLNGHMWALFGIYDYYRVTNDRLAKQMFDEGISILKTEIHKYDVNDWSVYAQTNRVDFVIGVYQQFINEQLRVLYTITGDTIFNKYANKWDNSLKNDQLFINLAATEFLKTNPLH